MMMDCTRACFLADGEEFVVVDDGQSWNFPLGDGMTCIGQSWFQLPPPWLASLRSSGRHAPIAPPSKAHFIRSNVHNLSARPRRLHKQTSARVLSSSVRLLFLCPHPSSSSPRPRRRLPRTPHPLVCAHKFALHAMGRSKPRTNKRPPPKPNRRGSPSTSSSAPPALHFDPTTSLFPPPSTLDPSDPNFPSAFQSWSTSALHQLNQLGQLPRLTPSQLSAIAGAAAGVSDAGLAAASHAAGHGPCIDLPQSLAALFEAKLTLDREKAKLMRMQKELSGYQNGREGAAIAGPAPAGAPPPLPTVKGKEVAPVLVAEEDDLAECTCGRNG